MLLQYTYDENGKFKCRHESCEELNRSYEHKPSLSRHERYTPHSCSDQCPVCKRTKRSFFLKSYSNSMDLNNRGNSTLSARDYEEFNNNVPQSQINNHPSTTINNNTKNDLNNEKNRITLNQDLLTNIKNSNNNNNNNNNAKSTNSINRNHNNFINNNNNNNNNSNSFNDDLLQRNNRFYIQDDFRNGSSQSLNDLLDADNEIEEKQIRKKGDIKAILNPG